MSVTSPPDLEPRPTDLAGLHLAIIVYACDVPGQATLYEESLTLIRAESTEDAIVKADAYARRPLSRYKNIDGQQVTWSLKGVVDLRHLLTETMGDQPEELLARHFWDYEAYSAFLSSVEPRDGGGSE